jgi:hypothetical protein
MAVKFCPGAANINGTPTLTVKNVPAAVMRWNYFQPICSKCAANAALSFTIIYNHVFNGVNMPVNVSAMRCMRN